VKVIKDGKIVGCAHDNSELGPRALGNRSIICRPDPEMKDILNAKIKFREWFRPFAPVCRLEDKDKYFDNAFESPFMSFAPTVKSKYRNSLKSITHVDNTARLQTVTKKQHSFLYNVLCEMEAQGMIPVILNTSFNIKGKPILTRYSSAFEALETTQLDYIFLDKKYLIGKLNER
jgi:carbamoyltransferase